MKKFSIAVTVLLLVAVCANAKIRRVGYFGLPIAGTDYTDLAAAQTAATAGDTILMFPATSINITLTKKLIIIGPGNLLDPASTPKGNANQQAFAGEATINQISCNTGSEGSVIMGFHNGTIYVNTNDITIRRNRDIAVYFASTNPGATINNLKVLENYRLTFGAYYTSYNAVSTNMNISNNFMSSFITATGSNTYSGNISNNIWAYDGTAAATNGGTLTLSGTNAIDFGGGAYLFQNNITASYTNAVPASNYNYFIFNNGGNTVFNYNVITQSYNAVNLGAGTGNVTVPVASIPAIFTAFPLIGAASADGRYTLAGGSPALVANRPGSSVNAGMYGGPSPYKLSTLPSIPSIYQLSSPDGNNPTGTSIQINLSTKGNN